MYYAVYVLGLIFSFINGRSKIFFMLFFLSLACLAFFRYGVGPDYFAYEYLFNRLDESPIHEFSFGLDQQEILFRLFGSLLKSIGFSYQQYLMVIAMINLYYISKICRKYSENPTLSLFLYFCFYYFVWTFSGLRQGMTLAIGIYYLLQCIEKNKFLKLIIVTIVLSFVHTSSIILIPLYLVSKIDFKKKTLIYFVLFSIFISLLPVGAFIQHLAWIPFMDRILPYTAFSNGLNNIFDFQSTIRIIFLCIIFFYYDAYTSRGGYSKRIINVYIISYCFYFLLKFSEITAARIALYGGLLNIILLANFYYLYKDQVNKLIYAICLIALSALYLTKELNSLEKLTGLDSVDSFQTPYTNIFHKNDYYFKNRYIDFLDE
ncbi:EpsG family protein [Rummeliibacillus suwonensis]|uniref:EpsG family protein n=1 Tax=Rummeliibacillus suwonensis TaxID=1306154 RepID=UPI00289A21C2|nr:EpsG family protein [Rummeliibacillus suwonensis]